MKKSEFKKLIREVIYESDIDLSKYSVDPVEKLLEMIIDMPLSPPPIKTWSLIKDRSKETLTIYREYKRVRNKTGIN